MKHFSFYRISVKNIVSRLDQENMQSSAKLTPNLVSITIYIPVYIQIQVMMSESQLRARCGGIPLSVFSNDTTSKLAGLFSTLSL